MLKLTPPARPCRLASLGGVENTKEKEAGTSGDHRTSLAQLGNATQDVQDEHMSRVQRR
jgi:hypothetical protein